MIGAIVGDIAGSRFEFCNLKRRDMIWCVVKRVLWMSADIQSCFCPSEI